MPPVLMFAVFAMAAALMFWNAGVMRRFKNDYRYDGAFHGNRYDCTLRLANLESGIVCRLGADTSAFYLFDAARAKRSWWSWPHWISLQQLFGTNLKIPWSDLAWREKRVLLRDCIWFEIPAHKIYFYVPSEVGEKLLVDAGRKIPSIDLLASIHS